MDTRLKQKEFFIIENVLIYIESVFSLPEAIHTDLPILIY